MKKMVSGFLAFLLLASVLILPAQVRAAAGSKLTVELPVISIHGNAQSIYDEDGVKVYDFDPSTDQIKECAKRVLPLLLKGFVTNNFDEYYRAFGEEVSKIYYHCQFDGNGEPMYGTDINAAEYARNAETMAYFPTEPDGKYNSLGHAYRFDWRRNPLETADGLDAFINAVLAQTGKPKVSLSCNCLGGEMLLAYAAKYGTDKIHALQFTETVAFGSELVDDTFSGRINIDPAAVVRFFGDEFMAQQMAGKETLLTFLNESIILAKETGALDRLSTAFMRGLYDRLYEGLAPELVLATYGTWPGYWTLVTKEHYAQTREFIFGKPGSERYEQYAGLIEKLDEWDVKVRQRIPDLLQSAMDNGTRVGISVRYGFQMPPILESSNLNGDVWVSVKNASLGATVSDIATTLPEAYLTRRAEEGFGTYLSPDKQIDASTCAFPEYTWFVKDAVHNASSIYVEALWAKFYDYDGTPTVHNLEGFPQFMVAETPSSPGALRLLQPMTEENMNTENFEVNPKEKTFFEKIRFFFDHLILWFKALSALLEQ